MRFESDRSVKKNLGFLIKIVYSQLTCENFDINDE